MKLILAAAAIVIAGVAMPTAHADQWDFISRLDNNGVPYSNMFDMIDLGKQVCHEMRAGSDLNLIMDDLVQKQLFTDGEAGFILGAASVTMCPDTRPRLEAY